MYNWDSSFIRNGIADSYKMISSNAKPVLINYFISIQLWLRNHPDGIRCIMWRAFYTFHMQRSLKTLKLGSIEIQIVLVLITTMEWWKHISWVAMDRMAHHWKLHQLQRRKSQTKSLAYKWTEQLKIALNLNRFCRIVENSAWQVCIEI